MSKFLSVSYKEISELNLTLPYLVVFSAFLSCFKSNLVVLRQGQTHYHRFTSYRLLDLTWLELLLEAEAICIDSIPVNNMHKLGDRLMVIQSRIDQPSKALGKELLQKAKDTVAKYPEQRVLLMDLLISILACECLDFVERKANKHSLDVIITTAPYEQLKILLKYYSLDEALCCLDSSIQRIVEGSDASTINLPNLIAAIEVDCEFLKEHEIHVSFAASSELSNKSTLHSHVIQQVLEIDEACLRSKSVLELLGLLEPIDREVSTLAPERNEQVASY